MSTHKIYPKKLMFMRNRFFQMIAAIGLVYIMSQFFRTANGVIAKDLTLEFKLSADSLGVLTGAFFLSFAIVQIPIGVLFDRFGPRIVMPVILLFAILGSLFFGFAENFSSLIVARLMMGVGVAPILMGALFLFGRWVSAEEYSTWMGRMIAIGGVGALLSASPLAFIADSYGWRYAFIGTAIITAVGGLFIWICVRDYPPNLSDKNFYKLVHQGSKETLWQNICGIKDLAKIKNLWQILAMAFVSYPVTITILGLWGAPWLIDIYGITRVEAGNILLLMAIALIISSVLIGPVEKKLNNRKWLVISCSCGIGMSLCILAIWPKPPLGFAIGILIFIGFAGAYNIIIAGHGRSLFPDQLAGRGMSLIGIALMGGPFIMQSLTGLIISSFEGYNGIMLSGEPYRAAFGFLAVCIIIASIFYSRIPDARPSEGFGRTKIN